MSREKLISTFKEKASMVSAVVHEAAGMEQALKTAVDLCGQKEPCRNLLPGHPTPFDGKILAAPNLDRLHYDHLQKRCQENGIFLIKEDIRQFPGGIDMGVTVMDFGIAETGTLVLNSDSEETRLATMLCETHVAVINTKDICMTALEMAEALNEMTKHASSYTAFITGASRTADIERVLALGVHGPLELHIMLIKGD